MRAIGETGADGRFRVAGVTLPPDRLPLAAISANLEAYRASSDSFLAADERLGWAPRPRARSRDGLKRANGAGVRSDVETAPDPPPGIDRIELFGDSFTFGDELPLSETWGARLEEDLRARGFAVEVLNFGVNAYGTDQAYLRWREAGRRYRPGIVIYGFQPENSLRNLNVFRPLYFAGTEIPLSKPRFVVDGDDLRLVNSPTVPPDQIVPVLSRLDSHPLAAFERFRPGDDGLPIPSRVVDLVRFAFVTRDDDPVARFGDDAEALAVTTGIVRRWAREVTDEGGTFLIVYLPRRSEIEARTSGRATWDARLLAALEAVAPVVTFDASALPLAGDDFAPGGHYGPRLSGMVASALAPRVAAILCQRTPAGGAAPACAAGGPPSDTP